LSVPEKKNLPRASSLPGQSGKALGSGDIEIDRAFFKEDLP
jgi:hypothetical protein